MIKCGTPLVRVAVSVKENRMDNMTDEQKRRYVARQKQFRKHTCHWKGCETQCPPAMWGCKKHWFTLPKTLRDKVWMYYRPGQEIKLNPSTKYLNVAKEVDKWIASYIK